MPVCVPASHIAMTSGRMEPVWTLLGESAGVGASIAVTDNVPVQKVDYGKLGSSMIELKQKRSRRIRPERGRSA